MLNKKLDELKPLLAAYVKKSLAQDADKWITVKPNGAENKGSHVKIDGETGEIKAGMGGKFNGQKISALKKEDGKFTSGNRRKPKKLDIRHKTEKVRDSIKNAVEKMGLSYSLDDSRASDSSYITVYEPDEDGDAKDGEVLKVRVADHKLPHGYEQPDINVTTSGEFDADDFLYAMLSIAEKFNKKLPPQVRGVITRKENEKKRKEAAAKEKAEEEAEARRKERENFINKNGREIIKNYENSALRPAQNSELWQKIDAAHINKSNRGNGWNLTMYEKGDARNTQKGATIPLTYNVAEVLGIDLPTNSGANSISAETENRVKNAFKRLKEHADKFYSSINS